MGNTCRTLEKKHHSTAVTKKGNKSFTKSSSTCSSESSIILIKQKQISEDYEVVEPPIGEGTFGNVYKVVKKFSGVERAAKRIELKLLDTRKEHLNEHDILTRLVNMG